jgi:hypothetical protein
MLVRKTVQGKFHNTLQDAEVDLTKGKTLPGMFW